MEIIFITEGGVQTGMGHIYETITLAKRLSKKSNLFFVIRGEKEARKKVRENGLNAIKFEKVQDLFPILDQRKPDRVIVDLHEATEEFIQKIRKNLSENSKLILIGNTFVNLPSNSTKYCDVIVDFQFGSGTFENRRYWNNDSETLHLEGPKYFIISSAFENIPKDKQRSFSHPKRILLIFGGSDASNYTAKVLDKLLSGDKNYTIDVIVGSSFVHHNPLENVLDSHQSKENSVNLYQDIKPEKVAKLMSHTEVIITSPGRSMFEALNLEKPVIAFWQNNLQKKAYQNLDFVFSSQKIERIRELVSNISSASSEVSNEIKKLNVGGGKEELLKVIIEGR